VRTYQQSLQFAEAVSRDMAPETLLGLERKELCIVRTDLGIHANLEEEDVVIRIRPPPAALGGIASATAKGTPPFGVEGVGSVGEDYGGRALAWQLALCCAHLPLQIAATVIARSRIVHVWRKEHQYIPRALRACPG